MNSAHVVTPKPAPLLKRIKKHHALLIMMLPALLYYIFFRYVPMYGVVIAFKDFNMRKGILGSPWAGFKYFDQMFSGYSFRSVFFNTLILGLMKLIIGFPIPILFALLLNEVRAVRFKKTVQTVSYLPHFLSWVVLGSVFIQFFSFSGPVNSLLSAMGFSKIGFFIDPEWFRVTVLITHIWKTFGWSSIVYIAAITSVDPQIVEAAVIDGATRIQRIRYIILPSIASVVTVMLILAAGDIIKDDFDQIFNLYNPAVYSTGDVLGTYSYRQGIVQTNFSYSTAVDLFRNVISLILVVITNQFARRVNDYSLW